MTACNSTAILLISLFLKAADCASVSVYVSHADKRVIWLRGKKKRQVREMSREDPPDN